jgi:hypothetical protein
MTNDGGHKQLRRNIGVTFERAGASRLVRLTGNTMHRTVGHAECPPPSPRWLHFLAIWLRINDSCIYAARAKLHNVMYNVMEQLTLASPS